MNTMPRQPVLFVSHGAPLLAVQFLQWNTRDLYFTRHLRLGPPARVVGYAVLAYCSLFLGGQPQSFVYFQF